MRHILIFAVFAAAASMAAAQAGMENKGEAFVEAIRNDESSKALALLNEQPSVIDARNGKGETALLMAIRRGDREWTGHLIRAGADVDVASRDGDRPLIAAARIGFDDAVAWLSELGVKIDAANKMGETALITAVQGRHVRTVRALLAAGADPDKSDHSGYSARDYAKRDTRTQELTKLIEATKPKK